MALTRRFPWGSGMAWGLHRLLWAGRCWPTPPLIRRGYQRLTVCRCTPPGGGFQPRSKLPGGGAVRKAAGRPDGAEESRNQWTLMKLREVTVVAAIAELDFQSDGTASSNLLRSSNEALRTAGPVRVSFKAIPFKGRLERGRRAASPLRKRKSGKELFSRNRLPSPAAYRQYPKNGSEG